ncbi:MAG: glycosyltransferase [Clostridia bacterium]|nr:glycosyltransferase [Clostridia bacterium]
MSREGLISVLMGIYNCEDTLPAAIDSILTQTYGNWELILCDDASTDGTVAVAQRYCERYPDKIRLLQNEEHRFLAYSLNRCLEAANGEFAARMDGDDLSESTRFEKQVAFLREHPDVDLVGTAMQRFDDDGSLGAVDRREDMPDRFSLHRGVPFNHATVMMRKRALEALGGYTVLPRTERGQDIDLWARFFKAGYRGANLPDALYRVRENAAAYKRRTAHVRWITCKTKCYAYRLLSYPWYWYWKPLAELLKVLVPTRLIQWIRKQKGR